MSTLLAIAGVLVGAFAIMIEFSPKDVTGGLSAWLPPTMAILTLGGLLLALGGLRLSYLAGKKTASPKTPVGAEKCVSLPTDEGRRLIYAANELHTHLLSYGQYLDEYVVPFLTQLSAPQDAWHDDNARLARDDFVSKARQARAVRRGNPNQALVGGRDFRSDMQRSEFEQFLTNFRDRLIAALSGQTMPARFNPFDD